MKTVTLIKDGDDLLLPIGDDMCSELGWEIGDTLEFVVKEDGTIVISKKKPEKVYVMVETESSFKAYYAYLVDADKIHLAITDVKCNNDPYEFSQQHMGEKVVGWNVLSKEEVLDAFTKQNGYAATWSDDKKLDSVTEL